MTAIIWQGDATTPTNCDAEVDNPLTPEHYAP
jgi:hypothetical protein